MMKLCSRCESEILTRRKELCEKCYQADYYNMIPLIKGGINDISNIMALCKSCNSRKHDRIPSWFEWRLGINENSTIPIDEMMLSINLSGNRPLFQNL